MIGGTSTMPAGPNVTCSHWAACAEVGESGIGWARTSVPSQPIRKRRACMVLLGEKDVPDGPSNSVAGAPRILLEPKFPITRASSRACV